MLYLLSLVRYSDQNHFLCKSVQKADFNKILPMSELITIFPFLMQLHLLIHVNCEYALCMIVGFFAVITCIFVLSFSHYLFFPARYVQVLSPQKPGAKTNPLVDCLNSFWYRAQH